MADKRVTFDKLGSAIAQELEDYRTAVTERVNVASEEAAKALVTTTKATAPEQTGSYKKHIAYKLLKDSPVGGKTFVWYVKPPDHRVTHLLVHGHATLNGGRTKSHPFLRNAWEKVQAEYERAVEEAVKHD